MFRRICALTGREVRPWPICAGWCVLVGSNGLASFPNRHTSQLRAHVTRTLHHREPEPHTRPSLPSIARRCVALCPCSGVIPQALPRHTHTHTHRRTFGGKGGGSCTIRANTPPPPRFCCIFSHLRPIGAAPLLLCSQSRAASWCVSEHHAVWFQPAHPSPLLPAVLS